MAALLIPFLGPCGNPLDHIAYIGLSVLRKNHQRNDRYWNKTTIHIYICPFAFFSKGSNRINKSNRKKEAFITYRYKQELVACFHSRFSILAIVWSTSSKTGTVHNLELQGNSSLKEVNGKLFFLSTPTASFDFSKVEIQYTSEISQTH